MSEGLFTELRVKTKNFVTLVTKLEINISLIFVKIKSGVYVFIRFFLGN